MANKEKLQELFLDHLKSSHQPITVFLTNGVKLQGRLTAVDEECLTLTRDGSTQLVYKHAISTVMPGSDFNINDIVEMDDHGNC